MQQDIEYKVEDVAEWLNVERTRSIIISALLWGDPK